MILLYYFKQLITFFAIIAFACAYPQLLIPTAVSHNSGILRNVPATVLGYGLPVNTIIATAVSDRDRTTLVDGRTLVNGQTLINGQSLTPSQVITIDARLNNQIAEQIAREVSNQIALRLNNNRNNNNQVSNEQYTNARTTDQSTEQEQFDQNTDTRNQERQLVQLQQLRTATNNRNGRFV